MRVIRSPVRWRSKKLRSLYWSLVNSLLRRLKITFWLSVSRKMTMRYRSPSRPSLTASITARMDSSGSGFCATITSSISRLVSAGLTSKSRQVSTQMLRAQICLSRYFLSMFIINQRICLSMRHFSSSGPSSHRGTLPALPRLAAVSHYRTIFLVFPLIFRYNSDGILIFQSFGGQNEA